MTLPQAEPDRKGAARRERTKTAAGRRCGGDPPDLHVRPAGQWLFPICPPRRSPSAGWKTSGAAPPGADGLLDVRQPVRDALVATTWRSAPVQAGLVRLRERRFCSA